MSATTPTAPAPVTPDPAGRGPAVGRVLGSRWLPLAVFIALAIEPLVVRLVGRGWRRGVAAAVSLIGLSVIVIALMGLFGNMFVQQVVAMVKGIPELYDQARDFISDHTDFVLPEKSSVGSEIMNNIQTSWLTDVAGQAVSTTMGSAPLRAAIWGTVVRRTVAWTLMALPRAGR